jgi:carboxyl-terminal processing protease
VGLKKMRVEKKSNRRGVVRALVFLLIVLVPATYVTENFDLITSQYTQYKFKQLTPKALNLAVFDAFAKTVDTEYYDATFSGIAWNTIKNGGRKSAADANSQFELYVNILHPITRLFPSSHFNVMPPREPIAKPTASTAKPVLLFNGDRDLGFEKASIRRGSERQLVVGDVLAGSPAEKNGIEPGWKIASSTIRANPNGSGHFDGIFSSGEQAEIRVSYDFDFGKSAQGYKKSVLPGSLTYIRFDQFDGASLSKAHKDIDTAKTNGLILDLRGNTGGYERHIYGLLGRLLPLGSAIGTKTYRDRTSSMHSFWPASPFKGPVVVLIGPKSSSAAEVVASALRFHRRATIIGRPSNGSVLEAKKFHLPDGGTLIVPVADYRAPDGTRIEGTGVQPDVLVVPTLADVRSGHDPALESAVSTLQRSH